METPVKCSTKRRLWRRKRQRKLKLTMRESRSPLENIGIKSLVIRKESCRNMREIGKQYFNSYVQGLCKNHISGKASKDRGLLEQRHSEVETSLQTVDLCDGDGLVENSRSIVSIVPSCEVTINGEPVIDLSQDLGDKNDIIDLTEAMSTPRVNCFENSRPDPIVIDISEEDPSDGHNDLKSENDEIFVIGTCSKNSNFTSKNELPLFSSLSSKWSNFITCNTILNKKSHKERWVLDKIDNKRNNQDVKDINEIKETSDKATKVSRVGTNIYVNSPVTLPSKGLRPIIIDGSNVAFVHSNCNFSCKRLEICINFFKEKGHKVIAFVPQFRINSSCSDNPLLLRKLERQGDVVFTPSKKVDGRNIVPYDDRYIVQTAVLKGGIIVSRDNFNDLLKENPAWAETIKYRTLPFTWVDDVLMFPKDPLGSYGPSLEEFLRFH